MKLNPGSGAKAALCFWLTAVAQPAPAQPPFVGVLRSSDRLAAMRVIAGHFPPSARLSWRWPQRRAQPGFCGWVSDASTSRPRQFFVVGERRGAAFAVLEAGLAEPGDRMVGDICESWGYSRTVGGGRR